MKRKNRCGGVLMPVFSLPSPYGIGTLGQAAYDFVDYLTRSGMSLWQVLPMGPTAFGDSPYQSPSAFAGNPYYIDLDMLIADYLLTEQELGELKYDNAQVDYKALFDTRFAVLRRAFSRFERSEERYVRFKKKHRRWLEDYAFFMALKDRFGGVSWQHFELPLRERSRAVMDEYRLQLAEDIEFYEFLQYKFFEQWGALKKYANKNGIKIVGDLPIYVALDSAECYFAPSMFQFDRSLTPRAVAGCPPDDFSADGQLWGNPLYDWNYHEKTDYKWWISRIKHSLQMYDIIRIDHFRGFESYYSIPYGSESAKDGSWVKGPGYRLFAAVRKKLGDVNIIAEDLGFLTKPVERLLARTGFPGMRVLQFAFSDRSAQNKYLPHNYRKNCVVYTGTHDNTTTLDYYQHERRAVQRYILKYFNCNENEIVYAFIRAALASTADMAIIPFADILQLGGTGRINTPSTLGNNWIWRIKRSDLTACSAKTLRELCRLYNR